MGTRSLLIVKDENNQTLMNMYRQFDGYPSGAGKEIAEFLDGMVIVNGFGSHTPKKAANGMGCLAAQLIAHFKEEIGGFYLHPASTRNCGEEYIYTITIDKNKGLMVRCRDVWEKKTIFFGTVPDFKKFCDKSGE